jgi:hypothetical protein
LLEIEVVFGVSISIFARVAQRRRSPKMALGGRTSRPILPDSVSRFVVGLIQWCCVHPPSGPPTFEDISREMKEKRFGLFPDVQLSLTMTPSAVERASTPLLEETDRETGGPTPEMNPMHNGPGPVDLHSPRPLGSVRPGDANSGSGAQPSLGPAPLLAAAAQAPAARTAVLRVSPGYIAAERLSPSEFLPPREARIAHFSYCRFSVLELSCVPGVGSFPILIERLGDPWR